MEQLTKDDYIKIVQCLGTLRMVVVGQPLPKDMNADLREQYMEIVLRQNKELFELIEKIDRIHLKNKS